MTTLKERILAADDLPTEKVEVPEWSETVYVRVMRGAERDSLSASMRDTAGNIDLLKYRARLLVRCLADESGAAIFTEAEVDALNSKNTVVLDRLFAVADKLNGTKADAVDAAEKN